MIAGELKRKVAKKSHNVSKKFMNLRSAAFKARPGAAGWASLVYAHTLSMKYSPELLKVADTHPHLTDEMANLKFKPKLTVAQRFLTGGDPPALPPARGNLRDIFGCNWIGRCYRH